MSATKLLKINNLSRSTSTVVSTTAISAHTTTTVTITKVATTYTTPTQTAYTTTTSTYFLGGNLYYAACVDNNYANNVDGHVFNGWNFPDSDDLTYYYAAYADLYCCCWSALYNGPPLGPWKLEIFDEPDTVCEVFGYDKCTAPEFPSKQAAQVLDDTSEPAYYAFGNGLCGQWNQFIMS